MAMRYARIKTASGNAGVSRYTQPRQALLPDAGFKLIDTMHTLDATLWFNVDTGEYVLKIVDPNNGTTLSRKRMRNHTVSALIKDGSLKPDGDMTASHQLHLTTKGVDRLNHTKQFNQQKEQQ